MILDIENKEVVDVSPYLDEKSGRLWDSLKQLFDIKVCYNNDNTYTVYTQNNTAIIYVPSYGNPCVDSFAHELLHIYFRSTKTYIGSAIILSVREIPILSLIISEQLLTHISNVLEHVKMYPIYLDMGYDKKMFISDYEKPKLTSDEVQVIKRDFCQKRIFRRNLYNASAVDFYIGKFFAANACPNPALNYSIYLNDLHNIDSELYSVLDCFWQKWMQYDVFCKRELWDSDYHDLCIDFIDGLKKWAKNKRFYPLHN